MIKGIEKLELTSAQRKLLDASEQNYKRFARIYFQVLEYTDTELIVKVWQVENASDNYLSGKELIERAKDVFKPVIPDGVRIHVRPVPFQKDDLKDFDISSVEKKMVELNLQAKDLVKLLDIDKSSLSLILNENRGLSKPHKAMFYYFFKYYELANVRR